MSDTFFDRFGGAEAFSTMVRGFYDAIAEDELIRPMYPDADLGPAEDRLRWFLEQYWGGPSTYSEQRGHPRLRMRHAEFHIATPEHDAWLQCMHAAVIDLDIAEELKEELWTYFQYAAHSMKNQPDT